MKYHTIIILYTCLSFSYSLITLRSCVGVYKQGRDGKGSIFVWANGNGGTADDCAADGYSSSIYTISVGAIGVGGEPSYYDEECSAKMTTAYVTDDRGYSAVVCVCVCVCGGGGGGGGGCDCRLATGCCASQELIVRRLSSCCD